MTSLPCRVCGAQPGIPCRDLRTNRRHTGRSHPGRATPLAGWPPRRGLTNGVRVTARDIIHGRAQHAAHNCQPPETDQLDLFG